MGSISLRIIYLKQFGKLYKFCLNKSIHPVLLLRDQYFQKSQYVVFNTSINNWINTSSNTFLLHFLMYCLAKNMENGLNTGVSCPMLKVSLIWASVADMLLVTTCCTHLQTQSVMMLVNADSLLRVELTYP